MTNIFQNKLVLIAGGGHFGTEAMISTRESSARVIIVDNWQDCKASKLADKQFKGINIDEASNVKSNSVIFFLADAIEFLKEFLMKAEVDFIVPAIPGHLAGLMVKKWLEEKGFKIYISTEVFQRILEDIPKSIISRYDKDMGTIIVSYMPAGRLCNLPCNQPQHICKTTGKPKAGAMYDILNFAIWNKVKVAKIIRSYKLQRDVGCFKGKEFKLFLSYLEKIDTPYDIAIGTSCSCHGILNLFQIY